MTTPSAPLPSRLKVLVLLALPLLIAPLAHAQALEDENLLQQLPEGYKVGHQVKRGNMRMTEFVPAQESVDNWTEMLTTQVFLGLKNVTPNEFRRVMQDGWAKSCKDAAFADVAAGEENGYAFEVWIQDCPKNEQTGKPEITWFKAIRGADSFYLVQKAFRFQPDAAQVVQCVRYLRGVQVCDSRQPARACPKVQ